MFSRAVVVALVTLTFVPVARSLPPTEAEAATKTVTRNFSNDDPIDIVTFQTHKSRIKVKGLDGGKVVDVDVVLNGFSHTLPDDVNVMIVAPNGRNAIVMSDAGATVDAANLTLRLDDEADQALPDFDPLSSGRFTPTNHNDGTPDQFLMPDAPTPSGKVALSTFNGINPNGNWTLYVYDDNAGDNGAFAGGWSLRIKAKVKQ